MADRESGEKSGVGYSDLRTPLTTADGAHINGIFDEDKSNDDLLKCG